MQVFAVSPALDPSEAERRQADHVASPLKVCIEFCFALHHLNRKNRYFRAVNTQLLIPLAPAHFRSKYGVRDFARGTNSPTTGLNVYNG